MSDHQTIAIPGELSKNETIYMENVSVRYRVPQEQIGSFREFLIRLLQRKIRFRSFLALDNINLKIKKGETFGLIGDNGAGKSTLLKVIAKVLHPTCGRIIAKGRVAPLLELGAGFHPELTGRENIFLNGAILGFNRKELEKIYPQIIEFSELGDFIDAPIRTYSSGMYARLGFSVATAYEPEILIVDEILGVGDESFQQKCADRIAQFRKNGTSILMVSHSMAKIEEMCQRAVWLDHGKIKIIGKPKDVINAYHERK